MSAADELRARIRAHGPIGFDEFMEVALYGPDGFYADPPVGAGRHFVTSPHVHPIFAELLGGAIASSWSDLGKTGPPDVIEIGAGDGTLAAQLLPHAGRYTAVETSAAGRRALAARGIDAVAELQDLPPGATAVLVANELLDNLPFHRVRANAEGLREIRVGLEGERFVETESACPPQVAHAAPPMEPGEEAAVSLRLPDVARDVARILGRGYAILIDYERAPGEPAGGVHGYRAHGLVTDVLADPGSADITAGVDLPALARAAHAAGLGVFGPVRQRDALVDLGFARWELAERERQGDLLRGGSGADAVRAWSDRNAAHLLVDPDGLGRLQWIVLGTPGLPRPSWFRDLP